MKQPSDEQIRARFDSLRATEMATAPAFGDVLKRAARRPVHATRRRWRLSALLALTAAAAILFTVDIARRVARANDAAVQPLSVWTSPTASLLHTSGSALLSSPTRVASILDGMTTTRLEPRETQP